MYREQHGEYDDLHTVGGIKAILKKKLIFQVSQNASHFVQPRPAFPLQWYFLTLHIPILSYLRKQEKPVLSKKPMTFLFNFKIRDEYHNIEYVTLWIFTLIVFSFRGWVFLILAADHFFECFDWTNYTKAYAKGARGIAKSSAFHLRDSAALSFY